VLIAALSAGTVAHAQAPADPAEAAYQEARRLYDLREWDAAIAKFKEAYRLRPDAPSLFNIAQSYRLQGDCIEAASFYRTYKRNFPGEKNIDKVDKFIVDMDACAKTQPAKPAPPKPEPIAPAPVNPEPTAVQAPVKTVVIVDADPGKTKRVAGLIVGGFGVVALGGSVFYALRARSAAQDAEKAKQGDTWSPAIESRGEAAARNGKIALGVGAALVGTGVVLYVLGRRSSAEATQVGVIPSHDGATLVFGSAF